MPGSQFNEAHQAYAIRPSLSFIFSGMIIGLVMCMRYNIDLDPLHLYFGGGVCLVSLSALVIRLLYPSYIKVGATKIELPRWIPGQTVTINLHEFMGFENVSDRHQKKLYFYLKDGKKYSFGSNSLKEWHKLQVELFKIMPCLDEKRVHPTANQIKRHQIYFGIGFVVCGGVCIFVPDTSVRIIFGVLSAFCLMMIEALYRGK